MYWQPPVGTMREAHAKTPVAVGHREGVQRQRRAQVVGHGPADNAAGVDVEQHGEVSPARARRHGDAVPDPETIRGRGGEIAHHALTGVAHPARLQQDVDLLRVGGSATLSIQYADLYGKCPIIW